ncbi:unnamed protein product [Ilex paraguariensis]|uniref:Uncharacterized protein n=1 Tax=Ilex paraguariensis TaxID=185542 RepID=A0ABC8UDI4_9AQUA
MKWRRMEALAPLAMVLGAQAATPFMGLSTLRSHARPALALGPNERRLGDDANGLEDALLGHAGKRAGKSVGNSGICQQGKKDGGPGLVDGHGVVTELDFGQLSGIRKQQADVLQMGTHSGKDMMKAAT